MINDKMAKMAVNTLIEYCHGKKCADCAVSGSCKLSNGNFKYFYSYPLVGVFENLQKSTKKPPKFDITLKDSTDFREYINEIFMREAEKAGLPMNTANSIKWSANGKIKVTFVDDDATYVGVAKCHPNDAFNPEIGIKLAIERAAQVMHAMNDMQHPNHYTWRGTECTKAIEIMTSGATGADAMYIGNIVKYLYRYPAKCTPLKDLMKARQYLDFLITNEEVKEKEHEKHD